MDGRRRLAQSLNWIAGLRARPPTASPLPRAHEARRAAREASLPASGLQRVLLRSWMKILRLRIPRGVGAAAAVSIILAGLCYGVVRGDHLPTIIATVSDLRDQAADALGFGIATVSVAGQRHVNREEVLATAGVTGHSSLLFLDVDTARERLKRNPWIADATVLKLYPGELQIRIKERTPFALWQKDRRVTVIADDGTVLETFVAPNLFTLPLVVGRGAATRARGFLAMLDRHPALRSQVRASIFVGERRWNLRLRNGLDIRLPEIGVAAALERLARLDRAVKLLSRDITAVDLRLRERVTVQLSERAAKARHEAIAKKSKKGGKA